MKQISNYDPYHEILKISRSFMFADTGRWPSYKAVLGFLFTISFRSLIFLPFQHVIDIDQSKAINQQIQFYIYLSMLYWVGLLVLLAAVYVFWKYYWTTTSEMKRYKKIFQKLGYTVLEQPYEFMGFSFVKEGQWGLQKHKDTRYIQKTVYPSVDVIIGNLIDKASIVFINPQLIKHFISNGSSYHQRYQKAMKAVKEVVGNGLIFCEGDESKKKRKLMSKVFNYDLIKQNIPKINQVCKKCIETYEEKGKKDEKHFSYGVREVAVRIFSGMMMSCFFGHDNLDEEVDGMNYGQFMVGTMLQAFFASLTLLVATFGKLAVRLGLTSNLRSIRRRTRLMRQKTMEILIKRKEELEKNPNFERSSDLTQAFALQQSKKQKDGFLFTDEDLVDQFHTFVIAGTDTTANYLSMMIYYLGNNPAAFKKAKDQVESIIKTEEDITNDNLKKLIYVDWVQMETNRLYDVVNGVFMRLAIEDHYVKDVPIKKDTVVWAQPNGNHYNPKIFKDPFEFRPERWEKECDQIHPYAFISFGAGPRSCLGKQLAILSSKIALVNFIRRYERFEVPKEVTLISQFVYEALPFNATFVKSSSK